METSQIFLLIRLVFLREHPFWKEEAQRHGPVTMNYTGKSNFIVYAHYSNGKSQLLANTIGDYSGQKVLRNPENTTCYIEVKSSGAWTVDLGYGDAVSVVPDIN